MFKRFFSLLLVLALALSFAMPAFAADEPETIQRGDLITDAAKAGAGVGLKKLANILSIVEDWYGSKHVFDNGTSATTAGKFTDGGSNCELYTPATWNAFVEAYKKADDLRNSYEAKLSVTDAEMSTVADSLTAAQALLDKLATPEEIAALKAQVAAAEEAAALIVQYDDADDTKDYHDGDTSSEEAVGKGTADGAPKHTGDSIWAAIFKAKDVYLDDPLAAAGSIKEEDATKITHYDVAKNAANLATVVEEANAYHKSTVTLRIAANKYEFDATTSTMTVVFTHNTPDGEFNPYIDDHTYRLSVKLNGGDAMALLYKNKGQAGAEMPFAATDKGLTIAEIKTMATTEKISMGLFGYVDDKFDKNDELTLILEARIKNPKRTEGYDYYWEKVEEVTLPCKAREDADVAFAAEAGLVAAYNTTDGYLNTQGVKVPADVQKELTETNANYFYINVNKGLNTIPHAKTDYANGLYYVIFKGTDFSAVTTGKYLSSKKYDPAVEKGQTATDGATSAADAPLHLKWAYKDVADKVGGLAVGDTVTVALVGYSKPDGNGAPSAKVIASTSIVLEALDKTELANYVKEKHLDSQEEVETNYGSYAKVTDVLTFLFNERGAKNIFAKKVNGDYPTEKGLVSYYLTNPDVRNYANWYQLGHAKTSTADATGKFGEVAAALKHMVSLVELKAAIAEAQALKETDYTNWNPGLMADALSNAVTVYNIMTTDLDKSGGMYDPGDGKSIPYASEDLYLYGYEKGPEKAKVSIEKAKLTDYYLNAIDDEKIAILLSELNIALGKLGDDEADLSVLQKLYDSIPTDLTGIPQILVDALNAAKAEAEKFLKSTDPIPATRQAEVDAAADALSKAIADLSTTVKGGFVEEDGKLYYYVNGEKVVGRAFEAEGKFWYASVKDGHIMKGGWINGALNGKVVKFYAKEDGSLLTGVQLDVEGAAYYFSVKDAHMMKGGMVTGPNGKQYIAGKDGKLLKDLQTLGANEYYCSVKDYHVFKAPKGSLTATVTGTQGKYIVDEKGVVLKHV